MGGLFGGKPQTASTQTVSAPQLPGYLQPYAEKAASEAQSLYNSNQLAPAYYPGQTVAPQSSATQGGYSATMGVAGDGSQLTGNAADQFNQTIQGQYLNPESNPYLRGAMNAANAGTVEQFRDATAPALLGTFSGAGRLSSGAVGNAYARTAGQLSDSLANANSTMAYQNYGDERNRQINAAANAGTVRGAQYTDAGKLSTAGALQDAYNQDVINADVEKYNYNANLPFNELQNYINLLNGTAGAAGNGSVTNSAQYGDTTRTAQTIGTALSLASLFSDRRLKENIRRIGRMPNGLNVYAYNYKGSDIPQAGVMADEVEVLIPGAVGEQDGFKTVNYGMLN